MASTPAAPSSNRAAWAFSKGKQADDDDNDNDDFDDFDNSEDWSNEWQ